MHLLFNISRYLRQLLYLMGVVACEEGNETFGSLWCWKVFRPLRTAKERTWGRMCHRSSHNSGLPHWTQTLWVQSCPPACSWREDESLTCGQPTPRGSDNAVSKGSCLKSCLEYQDCRAWGWAWPLPSVAHEGLIPWGAHGVRHKSWLSWVCF